MKSSTGKYAACALVAGIAAGATGMYFMSDKRNVRLFRRRAQRMINAASETLSDVRDMFK